MNFDVNTDPNIDQILTQLRVSQAQSQLPQDVNNFGVTSKSVLAPLMVLSLTSPNKTMTDLSGQLRLHQPGRSVVAAARHFQRAGIRRRTIRNAALGQT